MKILNYTFALFLIIGITTSCKDDDDEVQPGIEITDEDIIGNWNIVKFEIIEESVQKEIGIEITGKVEAIAKDFVDATANFSKIDNVNTMVSSGSCTMVATTYVSGIEAKTTEYPMEFPLAGTWSVDGDKLIITAPGSDPEEYLVTKSTESSLEFTLVEESTETVDGDEINLTNTRNIGLSK